ncbi:hypothetical protein FOZ63_028676 [Perkinsus olseni]|uniref:Cysteine protease n=1 Tax=Perkinsus olseni TaxID=32597 RepID=A0A7J6PDM2_PEROL|nr:hypothetical protein FOZ60_009196 [Perkinsus olseni]KAF4699628.1 hypothetical protein FOZ63_028676 [Perkinsus olseni]KAF4725630.1 hypothetical protein FOZ62_000248 [Perkinsus olseni]
MLSCALSLILAVVADGDRSLRVRDMFEAYKERFGHDFGDDDDYRMAVFEDNLRYIEEENSKGLSYTLKITPFTHLTNAEFKDTMFGRFPESQAPLGTTPNTFDFNGSVEELPKSVNYVTKGWVTEVKNQGTCGSCWAFSTTGALEALHKNVSGELVSLSEQELIDCSTHYHNWGCMGGWMNHSFLYVADHGLEAEKDYPYNSSKVPPWTPPRAPCRKDSKKDVIKAHSISYVNVTAESRLALLAALAHVGPVSVRVNGGSKAFQHYGGGVLDSDCPPELNHGVLGVGYDMVAYKPYYLVKNSWGTEWGDKGYIKIAINNSTEGLCGILMGPSYPINVSVRLTQSRASG